MRGPRKVVDPGPPIAHHGIAHQSDRRHQPRATVPRLLVVVALAVTSLTATVALARPAGATGVCPAAWTCTNVGGGGAPREADPEQWHLGAGGRRVQHFGH